MENNQAFGTWLREAYERRGETQFSLAQRLGVTETHVWRLVNGRSRPSERLLEKLAAVLGLEREELRRRARSESAPSAEAGSASLPHVPESARASDPPSRPLPEAALLEEVARRAAEEALRRAGIVPAPRHRPGQLPEGLLGRHDSPYHRFQTRMQELLFRYAAAGYRLPPGKRNWEMGADWTDEDVEAELGTWLERLAEANPGREVPELVEIQS